MPESRCNSAVYPTSEPGLGGEPGMTSLVERTPHGVLVVRPIDEREGRAQLLAQLHPEEAALATPWGDRRARCFAAGRAALRDALAVLGVEVAGPLLRSARGAPRLPRGIAASISHKDRLAAALACIDTSQVGVDIEDLDAVRDEIASQVLTPAELLVLPAQGRASALLLRFSLKEALYKALDPYVQRFVGFHEVEVEPRSDGSAVFALRLAREEGPFCVEGRWRIVDRAVLTTVRVTAA